MNIKKTIIPIIGIGALIGVLLKGNSRVVSNASRVMAKTVKEPEQTFGGVPLSKLNELAKEIYKGVKVTVDKWGFLIFHYKSNSGKTIHKPQIDINEFGKLVNLGGHHPNQWKSSADEFVKKANELFSFNK